MRSRSSLPGLLALGVLATGCLGGGNVPRTHHYVLEAPPSPARAEAGGVHIGVATLEVDPPYDQDRLVYRPARGGPEVGFYNYHRWAAPLGRLMASSLAGALAGVPGVASVEPGVAGVEYDVILFGRVIRVEEVEFADRSEARVSLALTLEGGTGELLWRGRVEGRASGRALDGRDAMELVQLAFGEAVDQLRRELGAALEGAAIGSAEK